MKLAATPATFVDMGTDDCRLANVRVISKKGESNVHELSSAIFFPYEDLQIFSERFF